MCEVVDKCVDRTHHGVHRALVRRSALSARVPTVKTPEERGTIGQWLRDARLARKWTQARAREEIARQTGVVVNPTSYGLWESGAREPSPENLELLERVFGAAPRPPMPPDLAAQVDEAVDRAMDRLGDRLEALLRELLPEDEQ